MISSPLPDSESSLSKFITLEAHFEVLKSIHCDTTIEALKPTFSDGILTTARKRYFLEDSGLVRRDKLVELIHEEGSFTERVKMVMYFIFLLRDSRYRTFICNQVADKNGKWNDTIFQSDSNAFFPKAGGRKAFTNLRQLLVHANLLDADFRVRQFPPLELWFGKAVDVAAQHIQDLSARQLFLASPQTILFKHHIHGLINATAQDLLNVETPVIDDESPDFLPSYSFRETTFTIEIPNLKPWNRSGPLKKENLDPKQFISNPALLERANWQHYLLEKMMASLCAQSGHSVSETSYIDMLAVCDTTVILFEMKSCTLTSTRGQVRRAISQLLEYSYIYREKIADPLLCMVLERKPRGPNGWLIKYVESLQICIVWKDDQSDRFVCPQYSRNQLEPHLPPASKWI